jgi:hypothetical protein
LVPGGAVLMRVASHAFSAASLGPSIRGAQRSLISSHRAGFVHCDIRPQNLLFFGEHGWQLVDYGESSAVGAVSNIPLSSAQLLAAGQRVKALAETAVGSETGATSIGIRWTPADDYEMLTELVLSVTGHDAGGLLEPMRNLGV